MSALPPKADIRIKRSWTWNAGDWWRRKSACALLLQVTPNLPNPAKYEADPHRDPDFDNHQQQQSHRYLPLELCAEASP
jgi:hypothetical protein